MLLHKVLALPGKVGKQPRQSIRVIPHDRFQQRTTPKSKQQPWQSEKKRERKERKKNRINK